MNEITRKNNQFIVDAINKWQSNENVHQLTCLNNGNDKLIPEIKDDCVILKCINCSYEQYDIPSIIIESYLFHKNREKENKRNLL